jgi:hypothetical protein
MTLARASVILDQSGYCFSIATQNSKAPKLMQSIYVKRVGGH